MTLPFSTIPELITQVSSRFSNPHAFNMRVADGWQSWSTDDFFDEVQRVSAGLRSLGVQKGSAVGLMAPSSVRWLMMDMAIMNIGAWTVPLFPDLSPENLQYEIENSGMDILVAANPEHYAPAADHVASFSHIILFSGSLDHSGFVAFENLLKKQAEETAGEPVHADDIASIVYTSGSSGVPKGAEIQHSNLCAQAIGCTIAFPLDVDKDRAVSCLPLAHIYERVTVYAYICSGISIYICDDINHAGVIMREVSPTIITVVPRILEKAYSRMLAGAMSGPWSKRLMGRLACRYARDDQPGGSHPDLGHWLSNKLVYARFRAAMGGAMRFAIVGGSSMDANVLRFLTNVGIPVYEGYGMTETTSVITVNTENACRLGTVGRSLQGVSIRVSADGEVQVKGPGIMRAYHNDAAKTSQVFTEDGWLKTGDMGQLDEDGYLSITGRIKDMFKTSVGKYVSPGAIEQELCRNALIEMAVVVGEKRKFVSCLLFPETDYFHKVKRGLGLDDVSDQECLSHPDFLEEVESLVDGVNETLNHWEQIRKFHLVLEPLSVDAGDLTPTMKIRRPVVLEKYQAEINAMYDETNTDADSNEMVES